MAAFNLNISVSPEIKLIVQNILFILRLIETD